MAKKQVEEDKQLKAVPKTSDEQDEEDKLDGIERSVLEKHRTQYQNQYINAKEQIEALRNQLEQAEKQRDLSLGALQAINRALQEQGGQEDAPGEA